MSKEEAVDPRLLKDAKQVARAFEIRRKNKDQILARWEAESREKAERIKRKFFSLGLLPFDRLGDQKVSAVLGRCK